MNRQSFQPSRSMTKWLIGAALLGGFILAAAFLLSPMRAAAGLLLVSFCLLGFGLAGAVFVSLQYVTGAVWSVAFRRVPEAMTAILPAGAVMLLAVVVLFPSLYPWSDPASQAGGLHAAFKEVWLSRPFFLARAVLYLAVWLLFAFAIVRTSRQQDSDCDFAYTRRNTRLSAGFLVAFGVTCWLASYDWIMSLEPEWYSTIFGVYHFAGLFLSGLAAVILLVVMLQRLGPLRHVLTKDHLHDLGKLLFGMSTFWAYIWYCQYMLIWYVNNPEETVHYLSRLQGIWQLLFWLSFALNWCVPFLALLPRAAKRNAAALCFVAVVVLIGRWLDLSVMIFPPVFQGNPQTWPAATGGSVFADLIFLLVFFIGSMMFSIGVFLLAFFRMARSAPFVPSCAGIEIVHSSV